MIRKTLLVLSLVLLVGTVVLWVWSYRGDLFVHVTPRRVIVAGLEYGRIRLSVFSGQHGPVKIGSRETNRWRQHDGFTWIGRHGDIQIRVWSLQGNGRFGIAYGSSANPFPSTYHRRQNPTDTLRFEIGIASTFLIEVREMPRHGLAPLAGGILRMWVPASLFALYPAIAFVRGPLRRYRRRRHGLCVSCGYDLTGDVSGVCPECGVKVETVKDG